MEDEARSPIGIGPDPLVLKSGSKDLEIGEAEVHVTCDEGQNFCNTVRLALEDKFKQYEAVFVEMPEHKRIRTDEGTLIKLKHITPELLKTIAEDVSRVSCVHKVRVLLNN